LPIPHHYQPQASLHVTASSIQNKLNCPEGGASKTERNRVTADLALKLLPFQLQLSSQRKLETELQRPTARKSIRTVRIQLLHCRNVVKCL